MRICGMAHMHFTRGGLKIKPSAFLCAALRHEEADTYDSICVMHLRHTESVMRMMLPFG